MLLFPNFSFSVLKTLVVVVCFLLLFDSFWFEWILEFKTFGFAYEIEGFRFYRVA
jgi:hypothetical protein